MTKELESLSGIKQAFASHLVRETSMTFEQALESLNYDTDLQNIEKALKELAEIKARGKEYIARLEEEKGKPYSMLLLGEDKVIELIDYILKGEKV